MTFAAFNATESQPALTVKEVASRPTRKASAAEESASRVTRKASAAKEIASSVTLFLPGIFAESEMHAACRVSDDASSDTGRPQSAAHGGFLTSDQSEERRA